MNIEPLGRDADLATVDEGRPEERSGHRRNIDVPQYDRRIIAAQFQRDPLQALRGARHHPLAGRRRSGEADLVDAGMRRHPRTERVAAAHDIQHAGRQMRPHQLAQFQHGERRVGRRLDHQRVAGQQRAGDFPDAQQHREIPRHDRADDADRHPAGFGPALERIFAHQDGNILGCDMAGPEGSAHQLLTCLGQRAPLLQREQPGEVGHVRADHLPDPADGGAARLDRRGAPAGKGRACGGDSCIQFRFAAQWCRRHHRFGRGIEHRHARRAGHALAVDRHGEVAVECRHILSPSSSGGQHNPG